MSSARARAAILALAACGAWLVAPTAAWAGHGAACFENEHADITWDAMFVAGTPRRLVLANRGGQLQVRRGRRDWSPVMAAPEGVVYAGGVADQDGALLQRQAGPGHGPEIVLVGLDGRIVERWARSGEGARLFSENGQRWLVTNEALLPLLPRSVVGPPEPLPPAFPKKGPFLLPPDLIDHGAGRVVLCLPTSTAMDGYGGGTCQRLGSEPWRAPNAYTGTTLGCDDWLIHQDGRQLAVRSIATGKVERELRQARRRELACAGSNTLVVVDRGALVVLALPGLREVARAAPSAKAPIEGVVSLGDEVAFFQTGVAGISFASPPCLSSPRSRSSASARSARTKDN